MNKLLIYLCLILCSSNLLDQEQTKRLNFILLIDNELPDPSIITGAFIVKDKADVIMDSISFDYHLGRLIMSAPDYKKIFNLNKDYRLFVIFKYRIFRPEYVEHTYETQIPKEWVNEENITLKIYNAFNKESRAKYYFKRGQKYVTQIEVPGMSTILTLTSNFYKHWLN